jgi:hypothetical protein
MAIRQPLGTVISDPDSITTEIGLALANGGVYAIQTTQDVYVTQVTENVYRQTINTTVNSPGGTTPGEVQFFDGRGFAADSAFKYDAATDSLSLRGNLNIVGNINLTGGVNGVGRLDLGTPSTFTIAGGNPGDVLSTDGLGNISWLAAEGATYSNANVVALLPVYTGNLTAGNAFLGNSVVSQYYTGTLVTPAQPNITSVGTLTSLSVSGPVTTGSMSVNGTIISSGNIQGSNISTTGNIIGLDLSINNITATGNLTLSQSILASKVTATHFGDGGNLTNINGNNIVGGVSTAGSANFANVANSVAGANVSGTVASATHAQSADVALSVSGSGVVGNVSTAVFAYTAGVANSVAGANVVGDVTSAITANFANYAGNVTVAAQPNITSVGTLTGLAVSGITTLGSNANVKITGGTAGQTIVTDGAGNLIWTTVSGGNDSNFANFAGNVTVAAQPNITSVGNLTGLNVDGIANLGPNSNVKITGGVTGQVLSTDGAGNLIWATVNDSTASNGSTSTEVNASNVTTVIGGTTVQTIAVNGVTITGNANVSGNVAASYFIGNGSQLTDITGANIIGDVTSAITANFANYAGNVTVAAQPNITSVGNLTGLNVDGITNLGLVGNVSITGGATGQVLTTDGSGILSWTTISTTEASNGTSSTQVNASNITNVIGGTTIQTIDANGVTITGNANVSGNVNASYFVGNGSQLTDINGANIIGDVTSAITANFANYAGNVTVADQPNITSVGELTGITSTGVANFIGASNVALGPVTNIHIDGGATGQVLSTDGSGTLSWVTVAAGGLPLANGTSQIDIPAADGDVEITAGSNAWTFGTNGGLTLPGANYTATSPVSVRAEYGFIVHPSHNTGGTGPELAISYNDGIEITPLTNDYLAGGTTAAPLFIQGSYNTTAGVVPGSVYVSPGRNTTDSTWGNVEIGSLGGIVKLRGDQIDLGDVAKINIDGGGAGQVLTTDGFGGLSWTSGSAGYSDADVAVYLPTYTGNLAGGNLVLSGTTSKIEAAGTIAILPSVGNTVDLGTTQLLGDITPVNAQGGNVGSALKPFFDGHFVNLNADNIIGDGGNIANIQGANVIGNVTSAITANFANFAGNVTVNAQPNITSVGTLTSLAVDGTTNLGAVGNVTITGGATGQVLTTNGSGVLSWAAAAGASFYDMKTDVIPHEVQYRDYDTSLGGASPLVTVTTRADASALKFGDVLQLLVYNTIANKPTGTLVEYVWGRDTTSGTYIWTQNVTLNSDNGISIDNYKTPLFGRSTSSDISFRFATQAFPVSSAKTFTTSNLPLSGSVGSTTLILTVTNSATITWPTGTKWPEGTPPTLGNGTHVVSLMTYDGGVTFLAAALTSYA